MSSTAVDAALQLPPHEVVQALAALPEDQWFEPKSARIKPRDFAITLVAMGNAEGGTIVLGPHDGRGGSHFDGKPLPAPAYRQSSGAVPLTRSALKSIDDDVLASLPRGAEAVLDVLRTAGRPPSTGEIIDAVGSSRPTATKQLQALKQHGLVVRNGKSARDPRATWSLP